LKLVLLDDHEIPRNALSQRLQGHDRIALVGATGDPEVARSIVEAHAPQVALVDPVRSDQRGTEVISWFRQMPELNRPLVYVHLAFFDPPTWERARAAGATDVILKQIDVDAIARSLLAGVAEYLPAERWPAILSTQG
jgi:DNA-binding NarL/FixJ family response regulator